MSRIWVVYDDPNIRELAREGIAVFEAADSAEALSKLESTRLTW